MGHHGFVACQPQAMINGKTGFRFCFSRAKLSAYQLLGEVDWRRFLQEIWLSAQNMFPQADRFLLQRRARSCRRRNMSYKLFAVRVSGCEPPRKYRVHDITHVVISTSVLLRTKLIEARDWSNTRGLAMFCNEIRYFSML